MGAFRKAAGLGQQEFGELLGGWSAASVSAAERSWDSNRVKKFDADELAKIAAALNLPLAALFIPPEDSETVVHYVLDPPLPGEDGADLDALVRYAFPSFGQEYGSSPVWDAYRQRLIAAGLGRLDKSMDLALQILAEAQRVASATIDAARGESDETLTRARHEADRRVVEAAARAEGLERDAQERWQAVIDVAVQRDDLERRVDDLRTFERDYRRNLRQFLEGAYRDFMAGVTGVDADALLEKMRRQAAVGGAGRVTAILLDSDGSYRVWPLDKVAGIAGETRDQDSAAAGSWYDEPADLAYAQGYDEDESAEQGERAALSDADIGLAAAAMREGGPGQYRVLRVGSTVRVVKVAEPSQPEQAQEGAHERQRLPAMFLP